MELADSLIQVAEELARSGTTRPRQAALRRAISTAYYAAFQFLVDETAKCVAGASAPAELRAFVARGIAHGGIKAVCKAVDAGRWPKVLDRVGVTVAAPSRALRDIASAFVLLQERRHDADYNPLLRFNRAEAIVAVGAARTLLRDWQQVSSAGERTVFLYLIAFASRRDD